MAQFEVLYGHVWWDCGKLGKLQTGYRVTNQRISSGFSQYETGVLQLDCDSQQCEIQEVNNLIFFRCGLF